MNFEYKILNREFNYPQNFVDNVSIVPMMKINDFVKEYENQRRLEMLNLIFDEGKKEENKKRHIKRVELTNYGGWFFLEVEFNGGKKKTLGWWKLNVDISKI